MKCCRAQEREIEVLVNNGEELLHWNGPYRLPSSTQCRILTASSLADGHLACAQTPL